MQTMQCQAKNLKNFTSPSVHSAVQPLIYLQKQLFRVKLLEIGSKKCIRARKIAPYAIRYTIYKYGAVAEWFKATVLKTVVPKGTGGSNPSCSVVLVVRIA